MYHRPRNGNPLLHPVRQSPHSLPEIRLQAQIASQGTVTLRNATVAATMPLVNQGTLVTNATVNINGPVTTAAGSVLRLSASVHDIDRDRSEHPIRADIDDDRTRFDPIAADHLWTAYSRDQDICPSANPGEIFTA